VDESAEFVATIDAERWGSGDSGLAAAYRHAKVKAPVRALVVVVPDVLVQDPVQYTVAMLISGRTAWAAAWTASAVRWTCRLPAFRPPRAAARSVASLVGATVRPVR
jgi:hypothetical protein